MSPATSHEVIQDMRLFLFGSRFMVPFTVWLVVILLLRLFLFVNGNVTDKVVSISIFFSGLSTCIFWLYRRRLKIGVHRWKSSPKVKFILIGSLGAIWVEFLFWVFEKVFGTTGIAANPNFLIDLFITIPWYILMITLLWKVETANTYNLRELVLFGGVYEFGADGLVGPFIGGTFSFAALPFIVLMIPMCVIIYSFMILPCSYLLKDEIASLRTITASRSTIDRYVSALLPLLGLTPYLIYGLLHVLL